MTYEQDVSESARALPYLRFIIKVYTKVALDYETKSAYGFLINTKDNPSNTSEGGDTTNIVHNQRDVTLLISLTDEQDTNPKFTEVSQTMSVLEHSNIVCL